MKKSTVAFVLIILALGAYFAYDAQWGRSFFLGLFSEEKKIVNELSLSFMEDIKFKDFEKAATYHSPEDQKEINIPRLIEKIFKIKPELLDIMDFRILETSLDSSRKRGRVKVKAKVHTLNSDKIEHPEMILYFHNKNGKWYMELESSLK